MLVALLILALSWPDVVAPLDHAILRMRGASLTDSWTCSVVVTAPGRALTAGHCVDGVDTQIVIGSRAAMVVRTNRILDVALIKFLPKPSDLVVPLAVATPKRGSEVAIVGFALGADELRTQYGHISAQRTQDEDAKDQIVLDVDVFPGDSGGALLNKQGQLVGLIVAGLGTGGAQQSYAVPVETLHDFLVDEVK